MHFPPAPRRPHHTSPLWYDSIINASAVGESHHNRALGKSKKRFRESLVGIGGRVRVMMETILLLVVRVLAGYP